VLCQSNENKVCFQQQTEWENAIDELWKLMQILKKSYNRMKKEIHYVYDWEVENSEGRDNGSLQYKVCKLGRL